jgi:plastocyanin
VVLRIRFVVVALLLVGAFTAPLFSTAEPVSAQDSSISIVDFAFSGGSITVEVGSTVTWTNDGSATHTVSADGAEFDSGDLAPGDSYSVTFDTPGTYGYHCNFHSEMTGTIVVVDSSDDGGTSEPAELPETGSGTGVSEPSMNLYLVMMAFVSFAGASMFKRRRRR